MVTTKEVVKSGLTSYFSQRREQFSNNDESKSHALYIANKFEVFEPMLLEAHNNDDDIFTFESMLPFVMFAKDNGVNIIKKFSSITNYAERSLSVDIDNLVSCFSSWSRENLESKIALLSFNKEFDWERLSKAILASVKDRSYYYLRSEFSQVLNLWAAQDRNSFTSFIKDSLKQGGYKHDIRSYFAYTSCYLGIIDKKQARKYRSECMSVSLQAAKGMTDGVKNYTKSLFAECASQFGDSKHWEVVSHLQNHLPVENLNVLFANDYASNDRLRHRINEYNLKKRELEREGGA